MAKVGRKPFSEPSVSWRIYLPGTLAAQIELLLLDPMRGKSRYGARTYLIEQLLRVWLRDTALRQAIQSDLENFKYGSSESLKDSESYVNNGAENEPFHDPLKETP
jgi:hypothetical protein